MRKITAAAVSAALAAIASGPLQSANAALYSFQCITSGASVDCAIVDSQAKVDVEGTATNVTFTFTNNSPPDLQSSISTIYFQNSDTILSNPSVVAEAPGVSFSLDSSPGNLPGGNALNPPFNTTWSFSAAPPPADWGINQDGDYLTLGFNGNITTVLNALNTQTVRVGIHDINFADGGSVSAVLVPEPGTLALLGSGLLALGGIGCRRKIKPS